MSGDGTPLRSVYRKTWVGDALRKRLPYGNFGSKRDVPVDVGKISGSDTGRVDEDVLANACGDPDLDEVTDCAD